MFNFLSDQGPDLYAKAPVVVGPFLRLLARLLKLAYLEGPRYQNCVEHVEKFVNKSTLHCIISMEFYTELTLDMQPQSGPGMSRNRRTGLCYRDTALPKIFESALKTLKSLNSGEVRIQDKNQEKKLMSVTIKLASTCLNFDFMGTIPDESNEEQGTVMIPHSWTFLRDDNMCKLFFDLYASCCSYQRTDVASECLKCLVLLASLRRSFFPKEDDRNKLLEHLITGTNGILAGKMGLDDPGCYHELCRLLGKINAAHQLSEL